MLSKSVQAFNDRVAASAVDRCFFVFRGTYNESKISSATRSHTPDGPKAARIPA
jgi:hypothetical protein